MKYPRLRGVLIFQKTLPYFFLSIEKRGYMKKEKKNSVAKVLQPNHRCVCHSCLMLRFFALVDLI
jgi:hypothetical protein